MDHRCGTCVHSVYLNSDHDYMLCKYPKVPDAYVHGFIHGSDCSFPGIHKDSGQDCPCYQEMDLTPSNGKWAVLKLCRILSNIVKDTDVTIVARFKTEKQAVAYCQVLRKIEPTEWNNTGIPFNIIYVRELDD